MGSGNSAVTLAARVVLLTFSLPRWSDSESDRQSVSPDDREESWSEPGSRDLESPRSDVPHRWVFPLNAAERLISLVLCHIFSPLGSIISLLRCCCCCCFGTTSERVLTKNRGRAAATCGERILSPFFCSAVFISAFGLLLSSSPSSLFCFPEEGREMTSCPLTAAGICC